LDFSYFTSFHFGWKSGIINKHSVTIPSLVALTLSVAADGVFFIL
jgi:hypothetical protein